MTVPRTPTHIGLDTAGELLAKSVSATAALIVVALVAAFALREGKG